MEASGGSRHGPLPRPTAQSRSVGPIASVVLCDNPGVFELEGTNTWILAGDGATSVVVVDPGPYGHGTHLDVVTQVAGSVVLIISTHGHHDHVGAVDDLVARTLAPARSFSAEHCRGAEPLADGEVLEVAGLRITVLHTPGHTADSVCLVVEDPRDRVVLTGDTILGTGTTLLDDRAEALGEYLASLDRLAQIGPARMLPGHGPEHGDVQPVVRAYQQHRQQRLSQIRGYLEDHHLDPRGADPRTVAHSVYAGIPADLFDAATVSVRTQLAFLVDPPPAG